MSGKKVIAVIQARMNSSRLSGKTMMDLGGRPLLQHVIERAAAMRGIERVIVATADTEDNVPILDLCGSLKTECFAGSPENVLDRYYSAALPHHPDYVMRITADNPFTDVEFGEMALSEALSTGADLSSVSGIPLGTGVEMIKFSALEDAEKKATEPHQFEHVTPYIKEHPELYDIRRFDSGLENPYTGLRLTVDTAEDFDFALRIYSALQPGGGFISSRQIIEYIRQFPKLLEINSFIEQRPMTHSESNG